MLLFNGLLNPIEFIIYLMALILAVSIHEFAHALTANFLGDSTPKNTGRLTLNPLAHLDLFGSLTLLLVGFGWGKPVIINPRNFSNPKIDEFLVALSGPASNLIQAIIAGLLTKYLAGSAPAFASISALIVQINIFLMLFNLTPIPPLDGSKVLRLFLSEDNFRLLESSSLALMFGLIVLIQLTPLGTLLSQTANNLTIWLIGG